jgi:ribosomal protein S1
MLEIGSVVRAQVVRTQPYGVYLQHGEDTILVLAPELHWRDWDFLQRINLGDVLDVYVLLRNYKSKEYSGSFKRLHPEENPYRALSRLEVGTVLPGKVTLVAGDEVSVELPDGVRGHIARRLLRRVPEEGEEIEVVIAGLLVDEARLWLEPARDAERGPACTIHVQVPQLAS